MLWPLYKGTGVHPKSKECQIYLQGQSQVTDALPPCAGALPLGRDGSLGGNLQ